MRPSLPISQFLPIVRWSQRAQTCVARRQPDVDEGRDDRADADRDDGKQREARVADQAGALPGAARVADRGFRASARRPAWPARTPATADRPRRRRTTPPESHDSAPASASTIATTISPIPPTRQAAAILIRPGCPRPGRASPRRARGWSGRAAGRGRPTCAARRAASRRRDAQHDRVLDRRDLVDPQPDRGRRWGPRRDAVGDVGGGPDRFARDDDEARCRGRRRRWRSRRGPRGPRTATRSRRSSNVTQPPSRRSWRRVRRKTSGRWASSSNSSSASIRPSTRT